MKFKGIYFQAGKGIVIPAVSMFKVNDFLMPFNTATVRFFYCKFNHAMCL